VSPATARDAALVLGDSRLSWVAPDAEQGLLFRAGADLGLRPLAGRALLHVVAAESPNAAHRRDLQRAIETLRARWLGPVALLLEPRPDLPLNPAGALLLGRALAAPDLLGPVSVLRCPDVPWPLARGVARILRLARLPACVVTQAQLPPELSQAVAAAPPGR